MITVIVVKLKGLVLLAVISPNDADRMVNSVDSDQTAPEEQSDLGLHCLLNHICPNPLRYDGMRSVVPRFFFVDSR